MPVSSLATLIALPLIGGHLAGRRDITLGQVTYVNPAVVTLLLVLIVAASAVTVAAARRPRHE